MYTKRAWTAYSRTKTEAPKHSATAQSWTKLLKRRCRCVRVTFALCVNADSLARSTFLLYTGNSRQARLALPLEGLVSHPLVLTKVSWLERFKRIGPPRPEPATSGL